MYETMLDFLANWLTEEWKLQYSDWRDALEAYVRDEPRRREALLREFGQLSATRPDETLMNELLHSHRAMLYPTMVAESYEAWARQARGLVQKLPPTTEYPNLSNLLAVVEVRCREDSNSNWIEQVAAYANYLPRDTPALLKELDQLSTNEASDPLLVDRAVRITSAPSFDEASARIKAAIESAAALS